METDNLTAAPKFSSLAEIENYKEQLKRDIRKDEDRITTLWKDLFHKEEHRGPKTPVQRVMGMVNVGTGVLDGVILGWKLYRKFRGGRLWNTRR